MEKSIERIWGEGFLQHDALVAPKLNDLYNQKSRHTVDKLMRMGRINLIAIMIGAAIIFIGSVLAETPYTGAFLFLQFSWLVRFSYKQGTEIEAIDKGLNSYQYLKTVNKNLKEIMASTARMYQFFYPLFFFVFMMGMWISIFGKQMFAQLLESYPDVHMILGIPLYVLLATGVLSAIFSAFSKKIYRWDVYLIYGPVLNKLEEMVQDMEELQN